MYLAGAKFSNYLVPTTNFKDKNKMLRFVAGTKYILMFSNAHSCSSLLTVIITDCYIVTVIVNDQNGDGNKTVAVTAMVSNDEQQKRKKLNRDRKGNETSIKELLYLKFYLFIL